MNITSVFSLIIVNLIPLVGVLLWNWNVFSLILLYWAENGIIGLFNVLKIYKAEGKNLAKATIRMNGRPLNSADKYVVIPFFVIHYGAFFLGHGFFIFIMFFDTNINFFEIFLTLLIIAVSHGYSFVFNFLKGEEYKLVSPSEQMMKPYSRVILMHLTIILGAMVVQSLGGPVWAMVIMVVLKIIMDISAHIKSHKFSN